MEKKLSNRESFNVFKPLDPFLFCRPAISEREVLFGAGSDRLCSKIDTDQLIQVKPLTGTGLDPDDMPIYGYASDDELPFDSQRDAIRSPDLGGSFE